VGVAGGASRGVVFVEGKPVGTIVEGQLADALVDAAKQFVDGKR